MTVTRTVRSTADLTPDGILGYAKFIAAGLAAVLVTVVEFLPDGDYKRWTLIAIAVLGAITTLAAPNYVKPVDTVAPGTGAGTGPLPPGPAGPVAPGL